MIVFLAFKSFKPPYFPCSCLNVVKSEDTAVQLATHQGNRSQRPQEAMRAPDPLENHCLISAPPVSFNVDKNFNRWIFFKKILIVKRGCAYHKISRFLSFRKPLKKLLIGLERKLLPWYSMLLCTLKKKNGPQLSSQISGRLVLQQFQRILEKL